MILVKEIGDKQKMNNAILIFFLGIITCAIGISFLVIIPAHTGYWAFDVIQYLRYIGIVR